MSGRLIVVGGHSRHVGKTTVISALLQYLHPQNWTAIKISAHSHGGAATARAAPPFEHLLRAADHEIAAAARFISRLRAGGKNVIVESNRILTCTHPDFVFFVIAPAILDWKPSSSLCLRRANAILLYGDGELPEQAIAAGGARVNNIPVFQIRSAFTPPSAIVRG